MEKSDLKVNSMKTELCLFYKNDTPPVTLKIGLDELSSKPTMNVLGIIFDTKMQWCPKVSQSIKKLTMRLTLFDWFENTCTWMAKA